MRKNVNKFIALTGISGFSLAAACIASVAWFISTIKITDINGTGTTDAAYFAYGTGTAEDPFGISEIRHLSNLSWLQYKGQFDDRPYYFELANDINADGEEYVMPPIGTETHPFIGVFDGQGYSVNNIKITNDYTQFTKKPHNITYTQSEAEVIGFFGVVGNLDGESFSSQINSLHDFTLENLTVESKTTNTLIGLAAGYINADMSGVKVGTSKISTNGNAAKTAYTDKLSDYGLVGYTTKTGSSGTFEQRLSQYYNSNSQGDDPGWGGSIVIKDLYNRLGTIRSNRARQNQTIGLSYDDVYSADGTKTRSIHQYRYNNRNYNMSAVLDAYNENTVKNGTTYNSKVGAVQMLYDGDSSGGIYYLSGGHYLTSTYYDYNTHTGYKICDKDGNYLSVASFTSNNSANAGTFAVTNEANATLWNVPSGSSGYISTKYCYNNGTETTYYLYVYNNTTLRLSTNNSRTTFTKTVDQSTGRIRYSSGNYYLACVNNSWTMVATPTAPNPTTYSSYFANSYQISYEGNYLSKSSNTLTGRATSLSSSATYGWKFTDGSTDLSLEDAIGQQVYIYTETNGTPYYIQDSDNSSPWTIKLTSNFNNADECVITRSGNGYKIAILSYQFVYDSNSNVFSSRSSSSVSQTSTLHDVLTIETTQSILANYQTILSNSYNIVSTSQTTATGPDEYLNDSRTTEGMDFSEQDVTYLPLNVDDSLQAKGTNTGYIIGGSYHNTAGSYNNTGNANNAYYYYDYGNVRIASFYTLSNGYLENYNTSTGTFNEDSVWTRDATGLHQIDDDNNSFVKYLESKGKVEQSLSGGDNIYGLHFMSAAINKQNAVTARYAMINDQEYQDYQMPANAIDFNLKEQGYVNFFAGTYGSVTNNRTPTIDSFFSLHQIKRSGSNIDEIYEIEEIYSDGVPYHSYVYKFSNGMYSIPYSIDKYNPRKIYILNTKTPLDDVEHGGYADGVYTQINQTTFTTNYGAYSKVFDMGWLKNYSYNTGYDGYRQAFYFEIPTNPGEYALGTVENKNFGAYLMYLDIAANAANKDQITAYAITTFQSGLKFPSGVDFNATDVSGDNGGETFAIIIVAGATSDGDIDFTVSGTTIAYDGDFATQYAYSEKPASGASPPAAAVLPPSTGTRVIYTHILTTDYLEWDIQVTETLDANGDATSTTITSVRCGGEPVTVEDIPESFVLNSIRPQVNSYVATFTRLSGENEFTIIPTYGGDDYKTVSLVIEMNGTTLEVSNIATGYTFTINGTPVSNNSVYPAS